MKSLLLAIMFTLSLTFANADEGGKKRKHSNVPKGKSSYSGEKKYKKTFGKKRVPTKKMFAGEGIRPKANKR